MTKLGSREPLQPDGCLIPRLRSGLPVRRGGPIVRRRAIRRSMASLVGSSTSLLKAVCLLTRFAARFRYRDLVASDRQFRYRVLDATQTGLDGDFTTTLEAGSLGVESQIR